MCSKPRRRASRADGRAHGRLSLLSGALASTRPLNCVLTFASVLLGGWLAAHAVPPALLLAGLSAALISAGGYVHNDLQDIATDRLNRPGRPLPSGRVTKGLARTVAWSLWVVGIGLSAWIPIPAPIVACGVLIALLVYNTWLKWVPLAGNLLVGSLGGLAFVYGGLAAGSPTQALVPACFAVIYHLGREIVKDMEDSKGDRASRGRTVPLEWGTGKAAVLASSCLVLLVLLTPVPAILGFYGTRYLALVLLLDVLLVYVVHQLWRRPGAERLGRLSRLLKGGMLVGLSAFFIDSL